MKLDNSSISTGDIQCLWWCDFGKLARNILTKFQTEINVPKRYLYETETRYFSFLMIEGKTIKSVKIPNSKPPPQGHLRQPEFPYLVKLRVDIDDFVGNQKFELCLLPLFRCSNQFFCDCTVTLTIFDV